MLELLMKNFLFNIMYLKIIILVFVIIFLVFISSKKIKNINDKNYRVALCISGAIRNKEIFCSNIIEKILKPYNPDIFICVYDGNNPSESKYLYDTLKPVTMMIHNKKPQKIKNKDFLENSVSMFEKIYLCNELKKQHENKYNFKYDVVIRIRPDLLINSDFKIDFENINDCFYSPNRSLYNVLGYVTDQVFYGSSDTIDKVVNLYKDLENQSDKCIIPEIVLKSYLKQNNIEIKYILANHIIIDYIIKNVFNINNLNDNLKAYKTLKKKEKYKERKMECVNYYINNFLI